MSSKSLETSDEMFRTWVQLQYLEHGFKKEGFVGYEKLTTHLNSMKTEKADRDKIRNIVKEHRKVPHGDPKSLGHPDVLSADKKQRLDLIKELQKKIIHPEPIHHPNKTPDGGPNQPLRPVPASSSSNQKKTKSPHQPTSPCKTQASSSAQPSNLNLSMTKHISKSRVDTAQPWFNYLAQKTSQFIGNVGKTSDQSIGSDSGAIGDEPMIEDEFINLLLSDTDRESADKWISIDIQHAPLVSRQTISLENQRLLPQIGLLGTYDSSPLFLNTNVPFSAFVCGVQGSGKSHTTSCILENSLIGSRYLGRLQNPLSAFVLSYGHFSGDGAGFSISEAAFLAAPGATLRAHPCVKRINVLVSPSNFVRISKLYSQIPNVTVSSFKLQPENLEIDIMLTLMAVNESDDLPLYMAQVTHILREIATSGRPFNYLDFKAQLKRCKFNPTQTNMLQLRLNLLESFLDLTGKSTNPQFQPGEITIMDMSCPFVDASTACILFKIGLQKFLQSKVQGKLIVLDEAHKYMLNNPGAKSLNESLLQTIRLQRHYGARVIVSTQEPTLLTDLIALCSIVIIHRFSSPEWFAALKRHIPMAEYNHDTLIHKIEGLKTGEALVYSSNAVLGSDEQGRPIKGAGKMMKILIRKRVTMDGGQSILAS